MGVACDTSGSSCFSSSSIDNDLALGALGINRIGPLDWFPGNGIVYNELARLTGPQPVE